MGGQRIGKLSCISHVHGISAVRNLVVVVDIVIIVIVVVVIIVVVNISYHIAHCCGRHHHEGEESRDREDTLLPLNADRGWGDHLVMLLLLASDKLKSEAGCYNE